MKGLDQRRHLSGVATGLRASGLVRTDRQGPSLRTRLRRAGSLSLLCGLQIGLLCLAGCQSPQPPAFEPLVARFYLEVSGGQPGARIQLPTSGVALTIQEKPVFTEYDLRNAEVAQVELGRCLMLELTPAAARDLHRLSVAQLGQRLVLCLNGAPVGARRIDQAIADGVILVFLETPEVDLATQAARLNRTSAELKAAAKKPTANSESHGH